MKLIPLELAEANNFIEAYHRHHKPVRGHRFSIGAIKDGVLVGVATVGRPVSRELDPKKVLEVTRLCSNGTQNACSFLYSAAARIGKAMGYLAIQTYILDSEEGVSLRAAGWEFSHKTYGRAWKRSDGASRRRDQPECDKHLYWKKLNL